MKRLFLCRLATPALLLLTAALPCGPSGVQAQTPPAPTPTPTPAPAPATLSISSSTHADVHARDFSDSATGFTAFAPTGGVPSGAVLKIEGGALKLTNAHPGSFGLSANLPAFDAMRFSHLAFDYKSGPNVRVNIFVRVKGKYHGIILFGPDRVRPGSVKLGVVPDVKADNQWHRALLPLRAWLQKVYPREDALVVDEMIIGNWDNTGYLAAGFGGNPAGATYWLDNWALVGPRSPEKKASFSIKSEGSGTLSYALDFDAPKPLNSKTLDLSPPDGFHILHVSRTERSEKPGGKAREVKASFPFWMSGTAPSAGAPRLKGSVLEVPITASAPIDVKAVRASVAGQAFEPGGAGASPTSPVKVEPSANGVVLQVFVGAAGMKWANGQAVPIEISAKDSLGRAVAGAKSELKVDYATQDVPPPAPRLVFAGRGPAWEQDGSFEHGEGGWVSAGSDGAIIERDASTKAGGQYSLRFTCPANAATFRSELPRGPIDVARFPILSFDYKIPPDLRLDFYLAVEGTVYRINWTDKGERTGAPIGTIANVVADNTWRHAEFGLAEALRVARPGGRKPIIDYLAIADSGWMGNSRGLQFWLDNFRFVPVEKGALQAQVQADDVTGVSAIAFAIDNAPETDPDTSKPVTGDRVVATANGRKYLHVRARNGAGQWSAPAHYALWLDAAPPYVKSEFPENNAEAAPLRQEWQVADDTGLDLSALALDVNGQRFSLQDNTFSFNRVSGTLAWSPVRAMQAGKFPALEDGGRVSWKLEGLADQAGNTEGPRQGSWVYKRASDKTAPAVAVTSTTHPILQAESFEAGLGGADLWEVREGATVERVAGAEPNSFALRAKATAAASPLWVRARGETWDSTKFPMLSFRYRMAREVKNLSVRLGLSDGTFWHVRLKGEANESLGQVREVLAEVDGNWTSLRDNKDAAKMTEQIEGDGRWRWAQVNLADMIKRYPKADATKVLSLDFLDPMRTAPAGAWFEIDDFVLSAPGGGDFKAAFDAFDVGGTDAFRVEWDQKPNTVPATEVAERERSVQAAAGVYFLHVQARDKAGNWSAPTHYPVMIR